jgi:hypothetical protein
MTLVAHHDLRERFRTAFFESLRTDERAPLLKEAALTQRLGAWTRELTAVTVLTCRRLNWQASAKAHRLELLPVPRSEYLGIDVVAFADGPKRWRFPVAVIELENSQQEDRIAYSLWKVIAVRANLRIVFCYRPSGALAPPLLKHLREEVVDAMGLAGRAKLEGQTLLVVGSRNESETFPYGYFAWWELNTNTGRFEKF